MKAKIILANFILSWFSLSTDTDHTPFLICMLAVAWFLISGVLFLMAANRGCYRKTEKRYKIDEL